MPLIYHTVSEGSLEKSAGRAALSSWALVDIGVTGFTGGTGGMRGCLGDAGGTALCLGVLGVRGFEVEGTVVEGIGKEGRSSSSLVLEWLRP